MLDQSPFSVQWYLREVSPNSELPDTSNACVKTNTVMNAKYLHVSFFFFSFAATAESLEAVPNYVVTGNKVYLIQSGRQCYN